MSLTPQVVLSSRHAGFLLGGLGLKHPKEESQKTDKERAEEDTFEQRQRVVEMVMVSAYIPVYTRVWLFMLEGSNPVSYQAPLLFSHVARSSGRSHTQSRL